MYDEGLIGEIRRLEHELKNKIQALESAEILLKMKDARIKELEEQIEDWRGERD